MFRDERGVDLLRWPMRARHDPRRMPMTIDEYFRTSEDDIPKGLLLLEEAS
jgi:hypothetical protein